MLDRGRETGTGKLRFFDKNISKMLKNNFWLFLKIQFIKTKAIFPATSLTKTV